MVEVFKTNIPDPSQAERFLEIFKSRFPHHKINFDLDDCDRILRIEGEADINLLVTKVILESGYWCEVLE